MDIRGLRNKRDKIVADARSILDVSEEAGGDLSAEDEQRFDALMDEADKIDSQIERELRAQAAEDREVEADLDDPEDPRPGDGRGDENWFREYIRSGRVTDQVRANQVTPDDTGGFLVPPQQFVEQLLADVDDLVVIRSLATGNTLTQAESLGVPTREADVSDSDWTTELGTGTEDDSLRFGKRELRPHPLAKLIKVSNTLLRRGALNPEDIVRERLAYRNAVSQEKAYMTGDGAEKPLGLFTASSQGISTARDVDIGSAGSIPLTSATADQLIDGKYTLKSQYHRRARWLFHRDIFATIRKIKDANNQYIWRPGFNGAPSTLDEIPYILSEFAPNTVSANSYVAMLGDFSFYWYVDSLAFQIQRLVELYAETNQVGFISRYEGDAMPVLEEAFVRFEVA